MRIKGKRIGAPKPRPCVIERDGEDFVFIVNAVLDYKEFEKLCPIPSPPKVMKPGGGVSEDSNNPKYAEALTKYGEKKTNWLMINAIKDTEGLEWEKVILDDPTTWEHFREELSEGGLTEGELAFLINDVYLVNSLDESKMSEARERFMRSQEAVDK